MGTSSAKYSSYLQDVVIQYGTTTEYTTSGLLGNEFEVALPYSGILGNEFTVILLGNDLGILGNEFYVALPYSGLLGNEFTVALPYSGILNNEFNVNGIISSDNLGNEFNINYLNASSVLGNSFTVSIPPGTSSAKYSSYLKNVVIQYGFPRDQSRLGHEFNIDFVTKTSNLGNEFTVAFPGSGVLGNEFTIPAIVKWDSSSLGNEFIVSSILGTSKLGQDFTVALPTSSNLRNEFTVTLQEFPSISALGNEFVIDGIVQPPTTSLLQNYFWGIIESLDRDWDSIELYPIPEVGDSSITILASGLFLDGKAGHEEGGGIGNDNRLYFVTLSHSEDEWETQTNYEYPQILIASGVIEDFTHDGSSDIDLRFEYNDENNDWYATFNPWYGNKDDYDPTGSRVPTTWNIYYKIIIYTINIIRSYVEEYRVQFRYFLDSIRSDDTRQPFAEDPNNPSDRYYSDEWCSNRWIINENISVYPSINNKTFTLHYNFFKRSGPTLFPTLSPIGSADHTFSVSPPVVYTHTFSGLSNLNYEDRIDFKAEAIISPIDTDIYARENRIEYGDNYWYAKNYDAWYARNYDGETRTWSDLNGDKLELAKILSVYTLPEEIITAIYRLPKLVTVAYNERNKPAAVVLFENINGQLVGTYKKLYNSIEDLGNDKEIESMPTVEINDFEAELDTDYPLAVTTTSLRGKMSRDKIALFVNSGVI